MPGTPPLCLFRCFPSIHHNHFFIFHYCPPSSILCGFTVSPPNAISWQVLVWAKQLGLAILDLPKVLSYQHIKSAADGGKPSACWKANPRVRPSCWHTSSNFSIHHLVSKPDIDSLASTYEWWRSPFSPLNFPTKQRHTSGSLAHSSSMSSTRFNTPLGISPTRPLSKYFWVEVMSVNTASK
jgi:hypothetical protein